MTRTLGEHLDPSTGPKRILALDGGGVKGILTLGMLKSLEAELRRRSGRRDLVLSDYYDLIGGTSTGAIIASGLALGLSVEDMIELYLSLGPKVFGRRSGDGFLFKPKYDPKDLRAALNGVLGRKTVGSPELKTGLAICAKRIDTGSPWVITNNPLSPYFDIEDADSATIPNKKYRLIDLVMASAAAPTYFDEVVIDIADDSDPTKAQRGYFVDGAVSANNNPSLQLLLLALVPAYGFGWRGGGEHLMLTSFGTGQRRPQYDGEALMDMQPALRAVEALKSMIYDTQIQGIMLMQALSEPKRPWKINSEIKDMRGVVLGQGPILDYQRIDALLPRKPAKVRGKKPELTALENLLGRELSDRVMRQIDDLDRHENMALLLEIGEKTAPHFIGSDYPDPHFNLPEWPRS
jgi:hypothetical protein